MAGKKKVAAKKSAGKKSLVHKDKHNEDGELVLSTEYVDIDLLKTYYKNPNIGDMAIIKESLEELTQYKAITVNRGTMTGRPNEILAGNHTYLSKKSLGKKRVLVGWVDVTEKTAAKIVAVDNASAKKSKYDEEALFEVLKIAEDHVATGFTEDEQKAIFDKYESELDGMEFDPDDMEFVDPTEPSKKPRFQDVPLGDEDDEAEPETLTPRQKEKAKEEGVDIQKASDELKGAYQLDDEMFFRKGSFKPWNYPALREDMLVQADDLPDNLTSWAGSATKGEQEKDPSIWYLYNWAIDSTSGMSNTSQVIVSFYCFDDYFENWWYTPAKYVAKCLNSGIKMICTPDFSPEIEHGLVFNMWQLFRARWVGRYCQEAGMKVIPNISWPDGDESFLEDHVLASLPERVPVAIMQLQTLDEKTMTGGPETLAKHVQMVIDRLDADVFILYSGKPGKEFFDKHINMGDTELRWLINRQHKLAEANKGREKKKGI